MIQNFETIIFFCKVIKAPYALRPEFKDSVNMLNCTKVNMHFYFLKSEM